MTWKEFKQWMEDPEINGVKDDDTIAYIDIHGGAFPNYTAKCTSDPNKPADWKVY